jgi:hypothetical protein
MIRKLIVIFVLILCIFSFSSAFAQLFGGQIKSKKDWSVLYPSGSIFCNGASVINDVTNPTTGKTWMDRNLGASQVATSSADAAAYGDLYQWGRRSDGHQCRTSTTTSILSSSDQPSHGNFILYPVVDFMDWRSPQNSNLWQGINGVNNPCPAGYRVPTETEWNAEKSSWSSNNAQGAYTGVLRLTLAGRRNHANGNLGSVGTLGVYWTSTANGLYSQRFNISDVDAATISEGRATGLSLRCIKEPIGTIGYLNCDGASISGSLIEGIEASNISASVPYTGGNGGFYSTQSIPSTGVSGLTASLSQGLFTTGAGSLILNISGTPSASGTASFALTIGGQSCSFTITLQSVLAAQYPAGSVFCASGPTAIVDVTNPTTGKVWMDRNLGASQVATSSTDAASYGDLYQWGRRSDGHQCRNSGTTGILSSLDQPANGNFIYVGTGSWSDWRNPQNNNLWQGLAGVNNPCPINYRIPTESELETERSSWSSNSIVGAFNSPLKLTMAGRRDGIAGSLLDVGIEARYWSSSVNGGFSNALGITTSNASIFPDGRVDGISVRCIKDASAIPATLGAINCGSTSITGTLTSGTAASGVSASVPYTGGNGGSYTVQTISSTGVTGLTATLTSGILTYGSGSLSLAISGTPSASGTASFALTIGGQSCSFTVSVAANLAAQYPAGSVFCASGPTAIVDVTNPTTGKIWMDRNLGAAQVATSLTDAAAYGDLYQWGRGNDGHQCRTSATTSTLSSTDQPGNGNFIYVLSAPFDWRSPQNTNLWQGVNGVNNPCPNGYRLPMETELLQEISSWPSTNASTAFNSLLKFTLTGNRVNGYGALSTVGTNGSYWTSSVSLTNSRGLNILSSAGGIITNDRGDGFAVRCIKDASAIPATLGAINCGSTSITGTLTSGTAASGVSASVPYTGGNGGSYTVQTISSTGVTGLTATLTSGILTYGSGSLSLAISGTPSASGTASFALTIGGQSCSFTVSVAANLAAQYPAGSVFCASGPTAIVDVTNPNTGKTWMDRNLGASQAATSSTDAAAYGDLYQWGRRSDGHQCRNSATTTILASTDQPLHSDFILTSNTPYDWRSPQNSNLWQGVNGINNPCPTGYRLPTETELINERQSWTQQNSAGAFNSVLKLPVSGLRMGNTGFLDFVNSYGVYWSSTINGNLTNILTFGLNTTSIDANTRVGGESVRCIKD